MPKTIIKQFPEMFELVNGDIIIDEFRLTKFIGQGGMGIVFLAYDTKLNRNVVIKFLKEEFVKNEKFVERFINEAKNIASLNHYNIVDIYSIEKYKKTWYIVMSYIDGQTLADLIKIEPLNWLDSLEIIDCINNALLHAHKKGVIHRDIKPANILISKDNIIKVVDFGLSKKILDISNVQINALSDDTDLIGTPMYIAPELWTSSKNISEKSDVFSLGITLYEIMTGVCPFHGSNTIELYQNLMVNSFKPASKIVTKHVIPDEIDELIKKMLIFDPNKRISCENVSKEINKILYKYCSKDLSKYNIKNNNIIKINNIDELNNILYKVDKEIINKDTLINKILLKIDKNEIQPIKDVKKQYRKFEFFYLFLIIIFILMLLLLQFSCMNFI